MAWLPGLESVCDRLRQSGLEQGSESDDEADASPYRINAYLRREFGLATPHAALSLSSLPDVSVATSPPPPLPPPSLLLDPTSAGASLAGARQADFEAATRVVLEFLDEST